MNLVVKCVRQLIMRGIILGVADVSMIGDMGVTRLDGFDLVRDTMDPGNVEAKCSVV